MLSGLFKKKDTKSTCRFCKVTIDKTTSFVLQYKTADGVDTMNICTECSNYLNTIIDAWEGLHEKDD